MPSGEQEWRNRRSHTGKETKPIQGVYWVGYCYKQLVACSQEIFLGEVLRNVFQHSSAREKKKEYLLFIFLVSHWLKAAPIFQTGHVWLPGGFPWAPHETASKELGMERPCQATLVWSWWDSSWNWLPLQWQEYKVCLRGFEVMYERWPMELLRDF